MDLGQLCRPSAWVGASASAASNLDRSIAQGATAEAGSHPSTLALAEAIGQLTEALASARRRRSTSAPTEGTSSRRSHGPLGRAYGLLAKAKAMCRTASRTERKEPIRLSQPPSPRWIP